MRDISKLKYNELTSAEKRKVAADIKRKEST